ncbi:hypothetical protein D6D19_01913 [Aureobasidium pullulans]|uniref:F-box domain-containing protein n=1 Tax=Aureobasidium pullulans TaxID=5580 RepID=A0A4S9AEV1_AURPU|nr:hypothetical protein D6D19_01913 [Aureobasidium pullulans]
MNKLPDEIVLQVLSFLEVHDLVTCQYLSRRFLDLCRDDNLWKLECFDASRAESRRKRQRVDPTNTQLHTLRSAFNQLSGQPSQPSDPDDGPRLSAVAETQRALANWDPSYGHENLSFYDEYIHRHAPISIGWLSMPGDDPSEATGLGLIQDSDSNPEHLAASLDDGSVCIWDVRPRDTDSDLSQGRIVGKSSPGLLSGGCRAGQSREEIRAIMTETGAVESVSIDNNRGRGYFAQNSTLVEVDLATLQVVSQEIFPFPVAALSQSRDSSLVVGTNWTIHIHDPRNKSKSAVDPSLRCEIIGGPSATHASLSQPGPLSILDRAEDESIWIAGRFTHLLNHDRRFFPRILGTVHSGGRISCIAETPRPYVPRSLDLLQNPTVTIADVYAAKTAHGSTILAAGEYKGKGSLEFYGLAPSSSGSVITESYRNRQTAASTRLLSVAAHGYSTVFSDGDGNLKWVERDGMTAIRSYNINEAVDPPSFNQAQSTAQGPDEPSQGDIVQKMIPLRPSGGSWSSKRADANQSELVLKTGDGRIGVLGFGHNTLYTREEKETIVETTEQRERRDAEKQYRETLGRALQSQADEVRFMRGLGLLG